MIKRICQVKGCKNMATEKHHLFSNTKWARKLYGVLLDRPENIMYLCYSHHHDKPLNKSTEKQFCAKLGITPRSKTSKIGGTNYDTN